MSKQKKTAKKKRGTYMQLTFGGGGLCCTAPVDVGGLPSIVVYPIKRHRIGGTVAKNEPKVGDFPKIVLRFAKTESAVVMLHCITRVLERLCGNDVPKKEKDK